MNKCECAICEDCGGDGNAWLSFQGTYLGQSRCDDLDELDVCPNCNGSGILETCIACEILAEEQR